MKFILIILISNLFSQFTLYKGNDYLRFAGNVSIYYNHRFYLENEDNFKKNRFGLKDARFQLKGELKQKLKYQIELDFAKFKGDTYIDEIEEIVEDELFKISEKMEFESFLIDAYMLFKFNSIGSSATFGYFKLPFTRNILGRSKDSPWADRADLIEDALNRRDLGVMITQKLFSDRLRINLGLFNGRGNITKNNDSSGKFEYISRIEYDFGFNLNPKYGKLILPGRLKIADRIDIRRTPIPTIGIGMSYKYADKEENIVYDDDHLWPLVVNGKKESIGFDFGMMYRGLSIQFDIYNKKITPSNHALDTGYFIDSNNVGQGPDGIINSFTDDITDSWRLWRVTEYNPSFNFGGKLLHINYFFKKLSLVTSFRWEEINPNSLIIDNWNTNLGLGICYMIHGMNTAIKFQFIKRLPEGMRMLDYITNNMKYNSDLDPWKESEMRITMQFLIR